MSVVDASFGNPMEPEEEAAAPLAGGIINFGFQCGMLWGASLAAGAEVFRHFGPGARAEDMAIRVSEKLIEIFRLRTRSEMNCAEITALNLQRMKGIAPMLKFLVKGGKIGPGACFRLAAGYARDAFNTIKSAFAEEPVRISSGPVSCAAVLAGKIGAAEKHVVMASGLAGGIGLSGGACGALGAAIWLRALNRHQEGADRLDYSDNPVFKAVVEKLMEKTDSRFECHEIAGRKFKRTGDHAAYLRDGGCSEIIEALAAP